MEKIKEALRVVLDTNVIVSAVSRKGGYAEIIDTLFDGEYELYVTTEILLEYEEIMIRFFDKEVAELMLSAMSLLPNVKKIEVYFNFNLIEHDKDDDKFVDCAFASNAHYLVTNDKHFNILRKIEFPKINTIKIDEFKDILVSKNKPQ